MPILIGLITFLSIQAYTVFSLVGRDIFLSSTSYEYSAAEKLSDQSVVGHIEQSKTKSQKLKEKIAYAPPN